MKQRNHLSTSDTLQDGNFVQQRLVDRRKLGKIRSQDVDLAAQRSIDFPLAGECLVFRIARGPCGLSDEAADLLGDVRIGVVNQCR